MKVIQTIAGTRLDHGGTSRSVPALCDALCREGIDNHLIVGVPVDPQIECRYPEELSRVSFVRESRLVRQWGIGQQFSAYLRQLTVEPRKTIVHDHGIWLPSNHAVARFCRRYRVARVVSPRGMLSVWALRRTRTLKRLAWQLYQRRDLETATAFHATSEMEVDSIRNLGLRKPILLSPNAVELPPLMPERQSDGNGRTAIFLSRIHPVKGLLTLVKAWALAQPPSDWSLLIVGPDESGHRAEVERLARELGICGRVRFRGPVEDKHKWQLLVNADLFILPSFSENFGIAIAEAMATGLPVITTTGTPWAKIREHRLGWWVEPTAEQLASALTEAVSMPRQHLNAMGERARNYLDATFSWQSTAQKHAEFYESLIVNDRPALAG